MLDYNAIIFCNLQFKISIYDFHYEAKIFSFSWMGPNRYYQKLIFFRRHTHYERKKVGYARIVRGVIIFAMIKKLPPEYFKRVFEKTTPVTELLFKFTETYIRSLASFFYFYLNFNFISSSEP